MTGVNIKVRADARQAQNEMRKLNASIQSIDKQAKNVTRTFQKLAIGITAAFAGSAITRGITTASDSMTNFRNRVNLVTKDAQKTTAVMGKLFDVAARSRGDVGTAAETFNRFGLALKDKNKPIEELLEVTEAVQKAAVISGAGAESAKNAIVQLGQGLAAGELRGEELNSVLEQMPRLAEAIADGMGIPFGKLKDAAKDGLLTAEGVYDAILSGAVKIDKEFATLDATTAGLFVVLKNEFTRAVAEMDKVVGISASIKDQILIATQAVRYFGQNIGDWAFILGSELLIAKSEVIFFTRDVKRALGDLFSGSLDGSALAQSVVDA
jgi:tape measure domain-containing protein